MSKPKIVSEKIDISDWSLPVIDALKDRMSKVILKATAEALAYAMSDEAMPRMGFPIIWAPNSDGKFGKAVKNPLTADVTLQLNGQSGVTMRFDMKEGLSFDLEACADDGSHKEGLAIFRDALRAWADDIDRAIQAAPDK